MMKIRVGNLVLILDSNEEAFCNKLTHQPHDPKCNSPFVSVELKHECSLFLYSLVAELKLKNIQINTKSEKII